MSTPRKAGGKNLKRRVVPAQTTKNNAADAADATPAEEQPGKKKHYIQPQVLEAIRKANGEHVTAAQLAEQIGAPVNSVQHSVLQLMKTVPQIEVITKGQIWRWDNKTTDLRRPEDRPEYLKQSQITGDFGRVPEPPQPVSAGAPLGVWYEVGHDAAGNPLVRKDGEQEIHRVEPL